MCPMVNICSFSGIKSAFDLINFVVCPPNIMQCLDPIFLKYFLNLLDSLTLPFHFFHPICLFTSLHSKYQSLLSFITIAASTIYSFGGVRMRKPSRCLQLHWFMTWQEALIDSAKAALFQVDPAPHRTYGLPGRAWAEFQFPFIPLAVCPGQ